MTSAVDIIRDPWLDIDPITARMSTAAQGYTDDELKIFRIGDNDIQALMAKILSLGTRGTEDTSRRGTVKVNLRPTVTDAAFEDAIDRTPTFTMTIHDPDWELLNLGALEQPFDINPGNIPHRWYRLVRFSVNDNDISLTFETRNAVYMAMHKRPFKTSRNKATRAQFIQSMLKKVKVVRIKMYCPQLTKKQKQAKLTADSRRQRTERRGQGLTSADKIEVQGSPANSTQLDTINKALEAGMDVGAPTLVMVSALMTLYVESNVGTTTTGNPPYVGPFQQRHSDGWPGTGDAYKDAKGNGKQGVKQGGYYGWAIPIYNKNPNVDLGLFCATVQGVVGSTNPLNSGYAQKANKFRDDAQKAVEKYTGSDVGGDTTSGTETSRAKFEFMVGDPDGPRGENYLGAAYRLAEEVNWRAYWVRDVLHYMSEEDLFKAKARTRLRRFENGVEHVNFEWDRGKKLQEMILQVRMERWVCPCGTVVIFDEGGPAQGRWLVAGIRRSMFDELGEITLRKPLREKLEPIKEASRSVQRGGPDPAADSTGSVPDSGDWSYPLEKKGELIGTPGVGTHSFSAPPNNWQSDNALDIRVPIGTRVYAVADATIVKAAGSWSGGSGRFDGLTVTLATDDGNEVFYQHNSFRPSHIVAGAKVKKGEMIAHSGAGNGVPHLHIACKNGSPLDNFGWRVRGK